MELYAQPSGPAPVTRLEKPWGFELIWACTDRYAAKLLHIQAGARLSLHLHRFKDETLYVHAGRLSLTVRVGTQLEEHVLGPAESFRIRPHTLHRLEALTDCDVLEASTPTENDLVRLEDDYGRANRPPARSPADASEWLRAGPP